MRPEPLTSAETDLRGLPWLPIDVGRLLDSDLYAIATPAEFRAAVSLWCKSWTQRPGASLPTDDRILARLSGAGDDWTSVRDVALRNWVECSDGRLYHPVMAEAALTAWTARVAYRARQHAAAMRKERERAERARLFDALRDAGLSPAYNTATRDLRAMAERIAHKVTDLSRVTSCDRHGDEPSPVTAKRGTGRGRDKALQASPGGDTRAHATRTHASAAADDRLSATEAWQMLEAAGASVGVMARARHAHRVTRWVENGVTTAQLRASIERAQAARAQAADATPINPGFLECHLADVCRGDGGRAPRRNGFGIGDELSRRFAAGEG